MPDNKYRMPPRNIIDAHNEVDKRLSKVERNPRIGNTAIDSGILSIKDGRIEIIDDNGNTVIQFGKFGDGLFGLRMLDGSGNIILDMGKGSDGLYSLRTNNAAGVLQTRMGQLASGGYGLESANAAAQLVSLSTLAFGISSASVNSSDSTTSTNYTDMSTFGPTVTTSIGNSGRCLVFVSASIDVGGTVPGGDRGMMSFTASPVASGVTISAQDNNGVWIGASDATNNNSMRASASSLITGLSTGLYTFVAKYRSIDGGQVNFDLRNLTVIPF